jgi:hypothetical protein
VIVTWDGEKRRKMAESQELYSPTAYELRRALIYLLALKVCLKKAENTAPDFGQDKPFIVVSLWMLDAAIMNLATDGNVTLFDFKVPPIEGAADIPF